MKNGLKLTEIDQLKRVTRGENDRQVPLTNSFHNGLLSQISCVSPKILSI